MANVLKVLTQRFQRHHLNDSPNQVKVSNGRCECVFNLLSPRHGSHWPYKPGVLTENFL